MSRASDLLSRLGGGDEPTATTNGDQPKPKLRPRDTASPSAPSRARRLLAPIPLAGTVLVLVALVGFLAVYSSTTDRTPVVVAAHELPAGAVLHASDIRVAELAGDRTVIAGLVPESDLGSIVGKRLTTAMPAGVPLARAAVAEQPAQTAFTLEVPTARALGGALQPGDRITVLATFGANSGDAQTRPVARDLTVLAVGASRQPGADTISVTIALPDASLASELALANDDAKLNLLREGGEDRAAPIPTAHAPAR